jgi:hypothetical protein
MRLRPEVHLVALMNIQQQAKKLYDEYREGYGSPWFDKKGFTRRLRKVARQTSRACDDPANVAAILYIDVISLRTGIEIER